MPQIGIGFVRIDIQQDMWIEPVSKKSLSVPYLFGLTYIGTHRLRLFEKFL